MIEDRDQTLINTPGWEFKLEIGKELLDKNEFQLAEKMLNDAFKLAVKKHGDDDPRLARIHSVLADLYSKEKNYSKAEESICKILEICENSIGPTNKILVKTLEKYSDLLKKMNRDQDAEKTKQRSEMISKKIKSLNKFKGT